MHKSELKTGSVLKKLMAKTGETLVSLSKATQVPKSTLSEWTSGRAPNPLQAAKVAKHLGVSLHFFLFGEDDSMEPIQRILKEDFFKGTFEITVKRVKVNKEE